MSVAVGVRVAVGVIVGVTVNVGRGVEVVVGIGVVVEVVVETAVAAACVGVSVMAGALGDRCAVISVVWVETQPSHVSAKLKRHPMNIHLLDNIAKTVIANLCL